MKAVKPITFAACILVAGASALVIGNATGNDAAQASITRLQILWPSIMTFSEQDRAFLAGLAMTCRLHDQPVERLEVVRCLQAAAIDPKAMLPKGESQSDAPDKLARLLKIAAN